MKALYEYSYFGQPTAGSAVTGKKAERPCEHSGLSPTTQGDERVGWVYFAWYSVPYEVLGDARRQAVKWVLAWQISEVMKAKGISKMEMARRKQTSRSQLDRFLDPENDKVLLETVQCAASAIGKRLSISLEDAKG